jgi:hypothetical protein
MIERDAERPTQQGAKVDMMMPKFSWPTSKPGPETTQPPPGEKPMPGRTEQNVELGYNQETGTPSTESPLRSLPDAATHGSTSFDLPTVQDRLRKRRR